MHNNIQRCLRQAAQIRSGHITAQSDIYMITRQRKEPHEFVRVVLPIVVGTRHADEIDGIRLPRTLFRQKCRKHGTCGLIPAIGKTPCETAAVQHGDRTGEPCPARNRLNIVADEPRCTAADDREQRRRLRRIGCECLPQILLCAEYNGVIIQLRADHTV